MSGGSSFPQLWSSQYKENNLVSKKRHQAKKKIYNTIYATAHLLKTSLWLIKLMIMLLSEKCNELSVDSKKILSEHTSS